MDDNIWGTIDDHCHTGMVWYMEEDKDLSIYGNTFKNFRYFHKLNSLKCYFSHQLDIQTGRGLSPQPPNHKVMTFFI